MSLVAVSLIALVFAFVGSLPLAGPIALLVVSNGVSGHYREALRIALGAALAEGIYAFLAFWGFATFLARYALVLPISHGVTALILVALGARFLFFTVKDEPAREGGEAKPARFWVGFSISALNPTLLATWGAVTTFLFSKQLVELTPVLAIPFGVFTAAGIALWGLMTVALLERFRHKLPTIALTWTVRGMGVILIAGGLWSGAKLVEYVSHASAKQAGAATAPFGSRRGGVDHRGEPRLAREPRRGGLRAPRRPRRRAASGRRAPGSALRVTATRPRPPRRPRAVRPVPRRARARPGPARGRGRTTSRRTRRARGSPTRGPRGRTSPRRTRAASRGSFRSSRGASSRSGGGSSSWGWPPAGTGRDAGGNDGRKAAARAIRPIRAGRVNERERLSWQAASTPDRTEAP